MTLDQLVATARLMALSGTFDGTEACRTYLDACRHVYRPLDACLIFTRDVGHHEGGWWKNPDYERCFHLSVSFLDGFSRRKGEILAKAFFDADAKLTWIEPPYTKHGKNVEVWHYRLFCDEAWQPIKPSGEVYSRRMPVGWMSFSERHGTAAKRKAAA